MMGVLNFAHASFYMLGAYVAYAVSSVFGFWVGVLVAPIVVGLIGMAIERFLLPRVHAHGHAHELLLTFGLALMIEELIKLFFGDFPVNYQMPAAMRFSAFEIFGANYPFYRLFIGAVQDHLRKGDDGGRAATHAGEHELVHRPRGRRRHSGWRGRGRHAWRVPGWLRWR